MTGLRAVFSREIASFFRTPIGWVVIALHAALSGVVFAFLVLEPGDPASLRPFFGLAGWLLLFVAPAVSMRLVSDELRSGTIEPLLTAPISDWVVITGKYAAAVVFLMLMLAPTLVYVAVLEVFSEPDYGPIAAGYLGLMLSGALYLAAGIFFSALTASQTLAFLGTLFTMLLARLVTTDALASRAPGAVAGWLYAVSIDRRLADFSRGVIDTADAAFFLLAAGWFVTLAGIALQSRRWR